MRYANEAVKKMITSKVRKIKAKVELYDGSTLVDTYYSNKKIKSFTIERIGDESKFFGYGICQRLNIHLIDKERAINITTANHFKVYLGIDNDYVNNFPKFYVEEVHRDENTNELSITAYDILYKTSKHTVSELNLTSYTIKEFASACGELIGAVTPISIENVGSTETCFSTDYPKGANFDGTETIREALDDVAEATQTIYYIDYQEYLTFHRLSQINPSLSINKSDYFNLSTRERRRLSTICHVTELGDNVSASTGVTGTTQYIRDNAFWNARDDIGTLLDNAIAAVGGLTIPQFDMEWRGNFLFEIGDRFYFTLKDDSRETGYLLNDTISYDGSLSEQTSWNYTDTEETESNPTSLGELLKQTYAKVDKVNSKIELAAGKIDKTTQEVENLSKIVMTPEEIEMMIKTEAPDGIKTETGFTFDEKGLSISKSNSDLSTLITENGMKIYNTEEEVLRVDNSGVDAVNLHATTYLWIGKNSRFEDYGETRSACFWVGTTQGGN